MSCCICSARHNIPFNQKPHSWSTVIISDFTIMELVSMDLKILRTSFRGYNYLFIIRCNYSWFLITDVLKSRKYSEVMESFFKTLICAQGTNRKEIDCDLNTAFKNDIMTTLTNVLAIKVTFHSIQSHQSNCAEYSIQSTSNLLIHSKIWKQMVFIP